MTASTINGVSTTYTYAGADQNQLLHEATRNGETYDNAYGKTTALGTAGLVMQADDGLHTVVSNDPIV